MLAVSPVPVEDIGARASDGRARVDTRSQHVPVRESSRAGDHGRAAAPSSRRAPSDPFPDKQWMESAYLAVWRRDAGGHDWEGVWLIGAAYHWDRTTSSPNALPSEAPTCTSRSCHHRTRCSRSRGGTLRKSGLVQRPSPSSPSSGAFTPPWTPSQKFFRTCSTRCRLRCATRCAARAHARGGLSQDVARATFRLSSTGPRQTRTSIGARVFFVTASRPSASWRRKPRRAVPASGRYAQDRPGFNVHLIALAGDEVLSQVPEKVYQEVPIQVRLMGAGGATPTLQQQPEARSLAQGCQRAAKAGAHLLTF